MTTHGSDRLAVVAVAAALALALPRPYAGGWNDGSRLATVEALVDQGTLAIDDSIFVRVPPDRSPYPPDRLDLAATGTLDKLHIDGRYYSDKGPIPAVLLAACYALVQSVSGLTAAKSPAAFCYLMNLLGGGLPFALALVLLHQLALDLLRSRPMAGLVTASFALATVAPAYAEHHNGHIVMLAVTSGIVWTTQRVTRPRGINTGGTSPRPAWGWWMLLGTLVGLGYTVDLAVGPAVALAVGAWAVIVSIQLRSARPVTLLFLAAFPWCVAHHLMVWDFAHTLGPPGAKPEYLDWPGSPFSPKNMTGLWHHRGVGAVARYAVDLLLGLRGFAWHNLPMLLGVVGLPSLWRGRPEFRPLLMMHFGWCALGFGAYALTSNNYSGQCLSIRWLVPMLAPAYWLLILTLRQSESRWGELALLTAFGAVLTLVGGWLGPWERLPLVIFWTTVPMAGVAWLAWIRGRWLTEAIGPRGAAILQFFLRGTNNNLSGSFPHRRPGGAPWPSSNVS